MGGLIVLVVSGTSHLTTPVRSLVGVRLFRSSTKVVASFCLAGALVRFEATAGEEVGVVLLLAIDAI